MFYKDISKTIILNHFFSSRVQLSLSKNWISKSCKQQSSRRQVCLHTPQVSYSFSNVVNVIKDKNPHVNSISDPAQIYWEKVQSAKAINSVITKFKIPSAIGEKSHFYHAQQQLYIALIKLSQNEELPTNLKEIFFNLHNTGLQNIANIKSQSHYKNDFLFNQYCLALFKGQKLLQEYKLPSNSRVQSDVVFMSALLKDKSPVSSFITYIVPQISLEELKECCHILLQQNLGDQVMRIINSPAEYLKETDREELKAEFFSFIQPEQIVSPSFLQQIFEFNHQVTKSNAEQDELKRKKAKQNCEKIIDVFFKSVITSKDISLHMPRIKSFLQTIQLSQMVIHKQQIFQFAKAFSRLEQLNSTTQHNILNITQNLEILNFKEAEKDEIINFLAEKRALCLDKISNTSLKGQKDASFQVIQDLCRAIKGVETEAELIKIQQYNNLQQLVQSAVDIKEIIQILVTVNRYSKEAAKLLAQPDIQALIKDNVQYLPPHSFSHLIALNNRLLSIPNDLMFEYAVKNHNTFPPLLLTQTLYLIYSNPSTTLKNDIEQLKEKIITELQNKKESLSYEELSLILKSLQFIKSEKELFHLQEIVEEISKERLQKEPNYANMLFILINHKFLKQGLQGKYGMNQIQLLVDLIKNEQLQLKELDLFNVALLIQATNKYSNGVNSEIINRFFIERASMQEKEPRHDQLAYIYISLIQSQQILKDQESFDLIEKYEKYIIQNLKSKNFKELIRPNQLIKIMHQLSKQYNFLEAPRKVFLKKVFDFTVTKCKIEEDYGLSIWLFWIQSLICDNIQQYTQLFNKIKNIIHTVAEHQVEDTNSQSVKFKQYGKNMKERIQEIQLIQLYQSFIYYQVNPNLHQKDAKLHQEMIDLQNVMNKNKSIIRFQRVQSVKHNSNSERHIFFVINAALKKLDVNYEVQFEKKLESIFFVDFYIEELKLIIECHGLQHYLDDSLFYSELKRNEYLTSKGHNLEIIQTEKWNTLSQEEQIASITNILTKYRK